MIDDVSVEQNMIHVAKGKDFSYLFVNSVIYKTKRTYYLTCLL